MTLNSKIQILRFLASNEFFFRERSKEMELPFTAIFDNNIKDRSSIVFNRKNTFRQRFSKNLSSLNHINHNTTLIIW